MKSDDPRRLWADHPVRECAYGRKRIQHPVAGLLTFPYETPAVSADPDRSLWGPHP
ncbi:hypothetical protein OG613_19650 [Streptomyces sp. NBC_00015]|uniref:MmyB family transcriptional regulator n=1 Tax=Streptomyces sp. NBC_00015 TaxID=2903611 RepID=UPI0032466B1C